VLDNLPPDAGLLKRGTFFFFYKIVGLARTGNLTRANCMTGSGTNRSAIHYDLLSDVKRGLEMCKTLSRAEMTTYVSVVVELVICQFELVKADDLFHPVGAAGGRVGVDVDPAKQRVVIMTIKRFPPNSNIGGQFLTLGVS
jgi:hypothetical protein